MYLHQQLIDNLLLHNKSKLCNLQSRYTCNIIRAKDTVNEWCNFRNKQNSVVKLRYQYAYKIYKFSYLYKQTRWCYIKGISYCNLNILNNIAMYGHLKLFELCMEYTKPNEKIMESAARFYNIKIFEKCISLGLKPTNDILECVILEDEDSNSDKGLVIAKLCLKHGVIPNIYTMECAISVKNVKAFELLLEFGLKPDEEIIQYIFLYDALEIFNEYL